MIRVGNKPTNEAVNNYDVVIDYSKAKVVNKTPYAIFPQIAIPLVINGRENYDDISISLWGGSKFSYDVRYNHVSHGGMLPHDFGDKHASVMNLEKITRDEFTKAYKNKAPNHSEIDSFLQSQVSKIWKGSNISAKGKISQALYDELVDKMASYFKMK